ncbi:MAG: hypothetical protein ACFFA8_13830 [Promethearchaeota archaeon]
MGNGKGLAYLALILGLIGAGLGGYVFFGYTLAPLLGFGETPAEIPEINSYYAENDQSTLTTIDTYELIEGMSISFTTTKTTTLHILFTCYVRIVTSLGTDAYLQILLNSTVLTTGNYYIEEFGTATYERFAVNMQNYIPDLAPGSYNITVLGRVDDLTTSFFQNSLYVQTHT